MEPVFFDRINKKYYYDAHRVVACTFCLFVVEGRDNDAQNHRIKPSDRRRREFYIEPRTPRYCYAGVGFNRKRFRVDSVHSAVGSDRQTGGKYKTKIYYVGIL